MITDHTTLVIFTFFWALFAPFMINAAVLWLPVVGDIRPAPMHLAGQRTLIFLGIVTIAITGGVRAFLMSAPSLVVCMEIIGLTFALTLALLDLQDRWLPGYLTVPMLLLGLLSAQISEITSASIYGAMAFWFGITLTMVIHSIIAKRNFMSGGDMTMAAACGAWIGIDKFAVFVGLVGMSHLAFCLLSYKFGADQKGEANPEGLPLGPALALTMLVLTIFH
ncbi:prepilin peptidase [Acetobacter malorum]|nr:prepilin peptidase [Acetobacter malorum]KXV06701.1 hypothetical protein AD930_06235 [Acetobacter malorum]